MEISGFHCHRSNTDFFLQDGTTTPSLSVRFLQAAAPVINGKRPRTCSHITVYYYETYLSMTRVPYISTYSDLRRDTRLCFFSPRAARRSKNTSGGHRRFQLWSLDHPWGTAWTQRHEAPLANEKCSPHRCGERQTICRPSQWCYKIYVCISVLGVVVWWCDVARVGCSPQTPNKAKVVAFV